MKLSKPITLEYTKSNLLILLNFGTTPNESPYSHKQIAEWCERFWSAFSDIDAPEDIKKIMPVLADVEAQWDMYLANTYTLSELQSKSFEDVILPIDWFIQWQHEASA